MFQRCSPLTTLCLDFSEESFGFITSRPLIISIRQYLINCCSVRCLCSGEYSKFSLCKSCVSAVLPTKSVRYQTYPVKPRNCLVIVSGRVTNSSSCFTMPRHKCSQIFCAITDISPHLSSPLHPPDCLFQLSLQLDLFHSFSYCNSSICHKEAFSLSACALDVDI